MFRYIFYFFIPLYLVADTSFITPMEYASQLYKNPRGIGCHHCHGENGEGKVVAKYIQKKKQKAFKAPAINNIQYYKFYNALNRRNKGMPRYFLTKKEIEALYLYLHKNDKEPTEKKVTHGK